MPVQSPVRTNYTLVDPDGTTTKLNEPGAGAERRDPGRAERRPARARRGRAVGGPVRLPAAVDARRLVRRAGHLAARHRRPRGRGHQRGPAARAAGGRPGRGAATCSSPTPRSWPSWPASPRTRSCGDPAATLAAVRTLHDRGVAEVLLTLGGDGALLSTADGGLWSAAAAADHRPQHRRRGRLQPRRLPARRPGRRPAGRAAAHRRRLRGGQRVAPRIRRPHPGPGGRRCSTGHRRSTRHQLRLRPRPGRRPGRPLNLRRGLHDRTDHPRPGRARRRPGRRQERGRAPAGRTGRRRRPGDQRRRRCTPTPWRGRRRPRPGSPAASRSRTAARRR